MRFIQIASRKVLIGAGAAVIAVAGAGAWLLWGQDSADEIRVGGQVLEEVQGTRRFDVGVKVTSPTQGEAAFNGEFIVDVSEGTASGELDMSSVTNDAGIFGDYETIPTAWRDFEGFFEITLPRGEWLSLDLDAASPPVGADIAWLRSAVLCNPNLAVAFIEAAQDPAAGSFEVDLSGDFASISPEASAAAATLQKDWGVDRVSIVVGGVEGALELRTRFLHPVVPTSQDDVEVTCKYTMTPTDEEPTLPDGSEIVTYEELSS